ncbi:MAG: aldehyde ferredoxin oxidoreductase family protein [Dehalococcoidia bacterium]|nr:aldehyde ferredoxin oxidoreductase family protein [Dehalococcoidia bacterium]
MAAGYNSKILRANLSDNSVSVEPLDELFCRRYLGGAGFISYYLLRELRHEIDPLSPENKLIFALGPVTGVQLPGSGRNCIGSKSPLTGGFGKSEVGGFWGAELKRAGYDAIIIEGKAKRPVYLRIHDGEASIEDGSHLWGKTTKETQHVIRAELGDSLTRVATIGLGGENLVSYACIVNDLRNFAGRGGMGAVMGSKNLKAIAVRGHKAPWVAEAERLKEFRKWVLANMQLVEGFHSLGTGAAMEYYEAKGNLPIRNFRDGIFPEVKMISAQAIKDTIRTKMEGCFACPVRCKKVVKFEEPFPVDSDYGGPEYETLAALGSDCGIGNLKAIAKGNELCSAYSLDTISVGSAIAFAMECFENRLLTVQDTGGIELRFGNAEAMLKIIDLIARREGIGDLLANGTARAARKIGRGAEDLAIQVKGLEAGMHEPRLKAGLGLGFAVNPHGADHACNLHDDLFSIEGQELDGVRPLGILEPIPGQEFSPRKVSLFRYTQQNRIIRDSLVLCQFLPYDYEQIAEILSAVTGWKTGVVEILKMAERTLTLARVFNMREGFTAADDRIPKRFFQAKTNGALIDSSIDPNQLDKAKHYYYVLMGWDEETGIPTPEKLEELDIAWVIPQIESLK